MPPGRHCLADPAAFPGWLRNIVRHYACRAVRRKHFEELPLEAATAVLSGDTASDECVGQREQIHRALAAIAKLPTRLREPAMLFYMHECSHQDIALFLNLSVTTVNNRLHAGAYLAAAGHSYRPENPVDRVRRSIRRLAHTPGSRLQIGSWRHRLVRRG